MVALECDQASSDTEFEKIEMVKAMTDTSKLLSLLHQVGLFLDAWERVLLWSED